jgi:hypothetical protein
MKEEEYRQITELANSKGLDPATDAPRLCRVLAEKDFAIVWAVMEDWFMTMYPQWARMYDGLAHPSKRGRSTGLSIPQARILKRMRDRGHTISVINGFFRWTSGHDRYLGRPTMQIMLERGWIAIVKPSKEGLEFEIIPTRNGLHALSLADMEYGDAL